MLGGFAQGRMVASPFANHPTPTERVLARVFREAGARVRFNAFLGHMNVGEPATDTRRIEVLAEDLPCFAGAQLYVDITLRSALTRNAEAQAQAENIDGAFLSEAKHDKERSYPVTPSRGRLGKPMDPHAVYRVYLQIQKILCNMATTKTTTTT